MLGTKIGAKTKNQKQWTLYMCYWIKDLKQEEFWLSWLGTHLLARKMSI